MASAPTFVWQSHYSLLRAIRECRHSHHGKDEFLFYSTFSLSFSLMRMSGLSLLTRGILACGGTMHKDGFTGRINSYNCGKRKYRKEGGTNSTTNYWLLQFLINMDTNVVVYGYFPDNQSVEVFGEIISQAFPSSKTIEGIVVKHFEKRYNRNP